eukprot:1415947-Rhodomonas_salina.1
MCGEQKSDLELPPRLSTLPRPRPREGVPRLGLWPLHSWSFALPKHAPHQYWTADGTTRSRAPLYLSTAHGKVERKNVQTAVLRYRHTLRQYRTARSTRIRRYLAAEQLSPVGLAAVLLRARTSRAECDASSGRRCLLRTPPTPTPEPARSID